MYTLISLCMDNVQASAQIMSKLVSKLTEKEMYMGHNIL
jgi:hypothetical protein